MKPWRGRREGVEGGDVEGELAWRSVLVGKAVGCGVWMVVVGWWGVR